MMEMTLVESIEEVRKRFGNHLLFDIEYRYFNDEYNTICYGFKMCSVSGLLKGTILSFSDKDSGRVSLVKHQFICGLTIDKSFAEIKLRRGTIIVYKDN